MGASIASCSFGNCFSGCPPINLILTNGITRIDSEKFESCKLRSVVIPDTVTEIGYSAFAKCSDLQNITLPEGLKHIDNFAFAWCTNMTAVKIPGTVTEIGDYAFSYCKNITALKIPDGVKSIGESSFSSCEKLTYLQIPDTVEKIGAEAFYGTALTFVELPRNCSYNDDGYKRSFPSKCRISRR